MWKTVAKTIVFTVPITVTALDTFGYVAKVEGASMQPLLNPVGQQTSDYVFLKRWKIHNYTFQRGEVVCVTCPRNPDQKLIKRIVALEGDTVKTSSYREQYVTVPSGQCWIEGDHHKLSMDSNVFGPVALGLITAKASCIVWPPSRWQLLKPASTEHRLVNGGIVEEIGLLDIVDDIISNSYDVLHDNDDS